MADERTHDTRTSSRPGGIREDEITYEAERPKLISWGAIFAGLFVIIAGSWLMFLLGIALNVSILDATDLGAAGTGLGIFSIIWLVLTAVIVYFVGSLLAARLTGKTEDTVGILHGITLWGAGTTLALALTFMGVRGLLQTGQNFVSAATSAVGETIETGAQGVEAAGSGVVRTVSYAVEHSDEIASTVGDLADTRLVDNLQATLKQQAAEAIAASDQPGGTGVRAGEVERAIEQIDRGTLEEIAGHLIAGETAEAEDALTGATTLTEREIEAIIGGVEQRAEELIGTADNNRSLARDIAAEMREGAAGFVAGLDAAGAPNVREAEIRRALRELDPEAMRTVALHLVQGDVDRAESVLASNTGLTEAQITDIVEGVQNEFQETIDAYWQDAEVVAEEAADYAQGVLWTAFGTIALSLIASIFGGWMGTEASRQIIVRRSATGRA